MGGINLKGTNRQHSGHMGKKKNYSKSLVRAIGEVLVMRCS